jgi:hypothetical protein
MRRLLAIPNASPRILISEKVLFLTRFLHATRK